MKRLLPMLLLLLLTAPSIARARAAEPGPADRAAAADETSARRLFDEGKRLFALRRFREALQKFTRAYELRPLSGFLFNLGQCHRFLGDCRQAVFFYSGFVRENPGTPDATLVEGLIDGCRQRLAAEQAQGEAAAKAYEEGKRALDLREFATAVARLKEAYRVQPRPGYLFHLAAAYQGLGQAGEALQFYRAYLTANPDAPQAQAVRAAMAECQRRVDEERRRAEADRIRRGLPPTPPDPGARRTPLHRKWWLWTTVLGVAAAAVGVGLGLGLQSGGSRSLPAHDLFMDLSGK
jgi:tetratricopeptide (TPR) repeat protein